MYIFWRNAVRYHFRPSRLTAICIVPNSDDDGVFSVTFILSDLPWTPFHLMPFRLCSYEWKPSAIACPEIFSVPRWSKFRPSRGDFGSSDVPFSNFSLPMCWYCQLFPLYSTMLISLLILYLYKNHLLLTVFYPVGILPKNKIRSIINSFIY